jgi:hypothetical protein
MYLVNVSRELFCKSGSISITPGLSSGVMAIASASGSHCEYAFAETFTGTI